jgi:hypothetical protein
MHEQKKQSTMKIVLLSRTDPALSVILVDREHSDVAAIRCMPMVIQAANDGTDTLFAIHCLERGGGWKRQSLAVERSKSRTRKASSGLDAKTTTDLLGKKKKKKGNLYSTKWNTYH